MKRVAAPVDPKQATAAAVTAALAKAKGRGSKARTPAEVDAVLDVILARLADVDD